LHTPDRLIRGARLGWHAVALMTLMPPVLAADELPNAAAIDAYLDRAVAETKIPGLVALAVDANGIVYSHVAGHRNVAGNVSMSTDTIFNIASMTKPVAVTAIMMLVEAGKLSLDDPISKYVPEFENKPVIATFDAGSAAYTTRPAASEVTIRQLLSHSSGLAYGFASDTMARLSQANPGVDVTTLPLLFDPGTAWTYAGGIAVVGRVVEQIEGRTLDVFLEERIFAPLGMSDTGYVVPAGTRGRLATVHRMTETGLVESPVPDDVRSAVSGDGGLFSTAEDYVKFVQMYLRGGVAPDGTRLISEESVRLVGRNQLGSVRVSLQDEPLPLLARAFPLGAGRDGFGLGFQVTGNHDIPGIRAPGSMSWAGIFNTEFWIDPATGIGAVLLMQYLPFYDEDAIMTLVGFEERLYEGLRSTRALLGVQTPPVPAQASPRPPSTPPWQAATLWPDRIIVTIEQDPRASFSVSWRTHGSVTETRAEIAPAADHTRIDLGAVAVAAVTESPDLLHKTIGDQVYKLRWNDYLERPAYHSVTFTGLDADTLYAYRVMGAEGHWSEWLQTRTAPTGSEPFKFLYFGDAQEGILSHWARVVREAYATAPDARFAIHAGDLVNFGSRDFEWAEWFRSVGFIHGMIPALPIVGNHEYYDGIVDESRRQITALTALWRPQFTLPLVPELPEALQETVYAVRYGDALIVVLDTMADQHFDAQAAWLDKILAESDAEWKIVAMHHPMFELLERNIPGLVETGPQRRALFLPVLVRHGVDLVLQGHDHSYGRGATYAPARGPRTQTPGDLGIVFVTSSSGAKMYGTAEMGWEAFGEHGAVLQRLAENTPFFQVISIDGAALTYEARTATGSVYDAFRIDKSRNGPNRITELPADIAEELSFENTPVYESSRLDVVPPLPSAAP